MNWSDHDRVLRWGPFFFQAEDGIRDLYVTGVQTCALPIWRRSFDWVELGAESLEHFQEVHSLRDRRRRRAVLALALEVILDVGDLERRELGARVPVERILFHRVVDAVRALNRVEYERAILDRSAHRAELVGRPRERHRSCARNSA